MKHYDITIEGQAYFTSEVDNVPAAGACTIDWKLGNKQRITLPAGVTVLTFLDPEGATTLTLRIIQGPGGGTITWPGGGKIKWSNGGTVPTLTAAASSVDLVGFYFDNYASGPKPTQYWGISSNNFL
jgi:hypothetical protein